MPSAFQLKNHAEDNPYIIKMRWLVEYVRAKRNFKKGILVIIVSDLNCTEYIGGFCC